MSYTVKVEKKNLSTSFSYPNFSILVKMRQKYVAASSKLVRSRIWKCTCQNMYACRQDYRWNSRVSQTSQNNKLVRIDTTCISLRNSTKPSGKKRISWNLLWGNIYMYFHFRTSIGTKKNRRWKSYMWLLQILYLTC